MTLGDLEHPFKVIQGNAMEKTKHCKLQIHNVHARFGPTYGKDASVFDDKEQRKLAEVTMASGIKTGSNCPT